MATAKTKKLSCGGVGPCCHIGYSHRHCEHCDTVIATAPAYVYPWLNPLPTARPYWTNGTQTLNGLPQSQSIPPSGASGTLYMEALNSMRATAADQSYNAALPPAPISAHLCEVK